MSIRFCVLGSGSSGNCTVVGLNGRADRARHVLIDVGFSPRAVRRRLAELGVALESVSAILLTHLDHDHFRHGWQKIIEQLDIPVYLHRRHQRRAGRSGLPMRQAVFFDGPFELDDLTGVTCVCLAHDAHGSSGFVIEHDGLRLGFATDLGRVPDGCFDCFNGLHALAIESNYDRGMQLESARPVFLKRRIMDGMGHLSNEQSLEAVLRIDRQSRLSHVVLLHLSRHCNQPGLVRSLYAQKAGHLLDRLTLTSQYEPTPMMKVEVGPRPAGSRPHFAAEQLSLFEPVLVGT